MTRTLATTLTLATIAASAPAADHPNFSGIYPHLAFFNDENECGTGAVVPWAGSLWAVTYAPHKPTGSTDKLYQITADLDLVVRPESIGGTPANRMVHRESNQLFIGPHAIAADGTVRTVPYQQMFGRPTGNARHLTDPAGKIYVASMEEGFYSVDVKTLGVTTHFHDEQTKGTPKADLPGYHGKGLYSGHGKLVYANNGEHGARARRDPFTPSGVLATWDGKSPEWDVVRRNQFTEVTGPGGIYGNANPDTDPVWTVGWDAKSLLLMCLDGEGWKTYRLPKASHSYDGAHGWNTEWPRIREIGTGDDFLMTMHGMFWHFPKTFSNNNTKGIAPRSSYLKVVGDFARWNDHVVLGCDDTAKSEFLNKRRAKGEIYAPQSQSNLWFIKPDQLSSFGPAIGRGAVWLDEKVAAGTPSDPFLLAGFKKRAAHIHVDTATTLVFEVDPDGTGDWQPLTTLAAAGTTWLEFPDDLDATWVRVTSAKPLQNATVAFTAGHDPRPTNPSPALFAGLARAGESNITGGILRARGGNERNLHFAARDASGDIGLYHLDPDMTLRPVDNPTEHAWLKKHAAIPDLTGVLEIDAASVVYTDDSGKRFRLPKGDPGFDQPGPLGPARLCREVATERDLFNCHGTFYELPAENATGFARVRPVATHNRRITDYGSHRGLLVLSGITADAPTSNQHIIRSTDGKTALWVGAIDDIWQLGKPVGRGGPWKDTTVEADEPSDRYLMTAYDQKTLTLSSKNPTTIKVEVDITGTGHWHHYKTFDLTPDTPAVTHTFPDHFHAYWLRTTSQKATTATAQLDYR